MSKAQLTAFLYKNKLNQKTIIDLLDSFSSTTIKSIIKDLSPLIPKNLDKDNLYNLDNLNNLYIFSDGNVKKNGQKDAKGGYSVYFGENELFKQFNQTKKINDPTNNKAELSGIKCIFKTLVDNQELFKKNNIVIVTDSKYSINCINGTWSNNWIKNEWLNSKKEPVKNKDLIKEILDYKNKCNIANLNIQFKHVFSHTIEPKNKESLEWKLWYGNWKVDNNINKIFRDVV